MMHICRGCDGTYDTCQPLWAQQRKCCPDCTHTHQPRRIQRRRTKGWRMPEGAIYVGRPTKWGNPWRITPETNHAMPFGRGAVVHHITEDAILGHFAADDAAYWAVQAYRRDLTDELVAAARAELRGHDLVCWCPLDQPCHADVQLELANG
ncbi:hypothetical protein VC60_gp73 [Mycobacterium phage Sbash]|uniref:DUF4326 domain-containing protein n=1 Tax=Mycobacterium phage Sbash TaxID=1567475 RepID=A0A0A7RVU4_9CAUD|nr:hypothetical protein VC60_gp73 [Mycobacterium phage Sbash]AJA43374.1 hypothetical protein PBI_SBASH_73 [Mycobacterium phage Sbash]